MAEKKITSFKNLNHAQLDEIAAAFGVDFAPDSNKNAKLSELAENGVTVAMWNEMIGDDEEEAPDEPEVVAEATPDEAVTPEPVKEEEKVLIKMTRFNHTYHIRGYQFSRKHPFQLVSEEDADYLCRVDGGFTMATPSEAKEYYS